MCTATAHAHAYSSCVCLGVHLQLQPGMTASWHTMFLSTRMAHMLHCGHTWHITEAIVSAVKSLRKSSMIAMASAAGGGTGGPALNARSGSLAHAFYAPHPTPGKVGVQGNCLWRSCTGQGRAHGNMLGWGGTRWHG